jgi:hypothetical protein
MFTTKCRFSGVVTHLPRSGCLYQRDSDSVEEVGELDKEYCGTTVPISVSRQTNGLDGRRIQIAPRSGDGRLINKYAVK